MKARIEKKLSKRLVLIHPALYRDAWIDEDISERAYEQGVRVSHYPSVGGGLDYWGEGQDAYTVWEDWKMNWEWHGPFGLFPAGHRFEDCPDTGNFRPTTRNLLKLAADCETAELAKWRPR